jgi:hypothetical protein
VIIVILIWDWPRKGRRGKETKAFVGRILERASTHRLCEIQPMRPHALDSFETIGRYYVKAALFAIDVGK